MCYCYYLGWRKRRVEERTRQCLSPAVFPPDAWAYLGHLVLPVGAGPWDEVTQHLAPNSVSKALWGWWKVPKGLPWKPGCVIDKQSSPREPECLATRMSRGQIILVPEPAQLLISPGHWVSGRLCLPARHPGLGGWLPSGVGKPLCLGGDTEGLCPLWIE